MALATPHVAIGGQQWSLQRKACVGYTHETVGSPCRPGRVGRPHSAFMQRELDSLVFRQGGLVYEASNSAEGRVRREREALLRAQHEGEHCAHLRQRARAKRRGGAAPGRGQRGDS